MGPTDVRRRLLLLIAVIILGGCAHRHFASPNPTANTAVDAFDVVPPIADADPSVRHSVSARVPAAMLVSRNEDFMTVAFSQLETTNLTVGHNMITGIRTQGSISCGGITRPRGMTLQSGLHFQTYTNVTKLSQSTTPNPGQEVTLEHTVTIFETEPAQHMRSPQSGEHYKILWTRTFRETMK